MPVTRKAKKGKKEAPSEAPSVDNAAPWTLFTDRKEMLMFSIIFTISQTIYFLTMYPSMAGGDSGELMTQAVEFGVAHPPGYPLLITLGWVWNKLIPVGTPVWKLNLLNTIISSLSNGVIYLIVQQVTYNNPAAVLTALWCAFSRLHWTWSLHFEVFSLNNLLTAGILLSMVKFSKERTGEGLVRGGKVCAVMCGLAMGNQHTSILIIIPGAVWVLATLLQHGVTEFKVWGNIALHGFAGLLLYLQIPVSAFFATARLYMNDQSSVMNSFLSLKSHVLREHYGTFKLASHEQKPSLSYNCNHWFTQSSSDFTIVVWLIAVVTVLLSNKLKSSTRALVRLLTAMIAVYMVVFGSLANLSVDKVSAVLERFWMQPNIILLCIAGIGIGEMLKKVEEMLDLESVEETPVATGSSMTVKLSGIGMVIVLLVSYQVQRNYFMMDQSNNFIYKNFADHVLNNAPDNSLVVAEGDSFVATMWYHIFGEERRPDMCPMNLNYINLMHYRDLIRKNCPGIVLRDETQERMMLYNFTTLFEDNYERFPILFCGGGDVAEKMVDPKIYAIWPWGLCRRAVRLQDNPSDQFLEYYSNDMPKVDLTTLTFPSKVKYPLKTFVSEYTFTHFLINGIEGPAMLLQSFANEEQNPGKKLLLMRKAKIHLENALPLIYTDHPLGNGMWMSNERDFRVYLHKHLGHVCLQLYTISTGTSTLQELERCARSNLQIFVKHEDTVDSRTPTTLTEEQVKNICSDREVARRWLRDESRNW